MRDDPKPAFHLIEPGGVGGRVMDVEAGALRQPDTHLGVLMGAVVVHDQVDVQIAWN